MPLRGRWRHSWLSARYGPVSGRVRHRIPGPAICVHLETTNKAMLIDVVLYIITRIRNRRRWQVDGRWFR